MAKINKIDPMDAVLSGIEKAMGNKGKKPTFSRFKDITVEEVDTVSFGIPAVDEASYGGGIPKGKMVEIFGPESSGKSLLTLYLIGSCQKGGKNAALLDVEQSFDPIWAAKHGVDVPNLVYSNDFACGENALEYAYQLCKSGAFGIVVVDSTAALTPKSELEGSLDDNAVIGELARIMSRGCRKIVDACGKTGTSCIFINQIREKVGVVYGNPETTPGGKALRFYSHQRIRVASKEKIKVKEGGEDVIVGQISTVTFVKNKTARPFGKCEFKIIFDATALNPVVMLCNSLKTAKLVKTYKGLFNIPKDVLSKDKIDTGATTIIELANYLIKEDLVLTMLEKLEESLADGDFEGPIDEAILEMKTSPEKIVSPTLDNVVDLKTEAVKIGDAKKDEVGEQDDDSPPDEDKEDIV